MEKQLRGQRAQELLRNEILLQSLKEMEEHYIEAWKKGRTIEVREDAHRYVTLLSNFKDHLSSLVLTGALDAKRIAELEGRRSLWK